MTIPYIPCIPYICPMPLPLKIKMLLLLDRWMDQDINKLEPVQARLAMRKTQERFKWLMQYKDELLHSVEERPVVLNNGLIKVRIYRPTADESLPIIMFYHGGGFVQGDVYTHDHNCQRLCRQNNAVVISVEYRLAPEFPFPIPAEDCYGALTWAVENASGFGGDPSRIAVMGDSAGGNLATVVAMMSRDRGGPEISAQVLIYPALDATLSMTSVSRLARGYFLTKAKMQWYVGHYTRNQADKRHPYLSPLFAPDLTKLPPALIITAEFDPLIDDGDEYSKRLKEAGVHVEYTRYAGMIHAFFSMPRFLPEARQAEEQVKRFLTKWLA